MQEKKTIRIKFGPISKPLTQQLKPQGFEFKDNPQRDWQNLYNELVDLYINGIITNTERNTIMKRFTNEICKDLDFVIEEKGGEVEETKTDKKVKKEEKAN